MMLSCICLAKTYNSVAMCTTVRDIDYCVLKDLQYTVTSNESTATIKSKFGQIDYSVSSRSNMAGIEISVAADAEGEFTMIVDDGTGIWFSSKSACYVQKFWPSVSAEFKKKYHFVTLDTYDDLFGMLTQCELDYMRERGNR